MVISARPVSAGPGLPPVAAGAHSGWKPQPASNSSNSVAGMDRSAAGTAYPASTKLTMRFGT